MPATLRILHISDLHATPGRHAFRMHRVLGDSWKRNLDELLKDGPFDLVCFTGDVAFAGRAEDYALAHTLLVQLLEPLGLPMERLFVVPGNHDIDREVGKESWDTLRKLQHHTEAEALAEWMGQGKLPRGFEKGQREQLLSRQAAYRGWVKNTLQRPDLLPENSPHGTLGYRSTLRLPHLPFEIHVIGLDSAWAAGNNDDSGKLLLTDEQVAMLTATADYKALPGLRLALIHHPLEQLADGKYASRMLARNVDLLLRGHLHETAIETLMEPGLISRQFAAGCLYGSDRWPNACHAITLDLDEQGRIQRYALRFRTWSPQGEHWFDDGGVYPQAPGGRWQWPPAPASQGLRPPPPVFIGREAELEQIRECVWPAPARPPQPVCLQGMAGVGKTTLAEQFFESHQEHLPGGMQRLILNPQAPLRAEQLLQQLAERLGLRVGQERLAEHVREHLHGARVLVLVENVDSEKAADESVALVRQLRGCPVVLTGRLLGLGAAAGWKLIEVPAFKEAQALQQLEAEWKQARIQPLARLKELADALGSLPLALHLAAGYLNHGGHSVSSFLTELQAQELKLGPVDRSDRLLDGTHDPARAGLASTFELSFQLLREKLGAEAERMLAGLGALGHAPASGFGASLGAAVAGLPEQELRRLLHPALQLSLLSQVPGREEAWRIHPLVAEFLRHKPGTAEGFVRLGEWFLSRLPTLGTGQEEEQGRRWKVLHQEAEALVDWLARVRPEDSARVSQGSTVYARSNGPYVAWIAFCERALSSPISDDARSSLLWTLGQVAYQGGALNQALNAAGEKSRLDRKRNDERGVALSAGMRADILQARGELDEALRIRREEELPVYEKLGDVRERAITQGQIADILQARGKLDEALRIRREESLPVYEKLGDVRSRAITQGKIANILQARGKLDEALRIQREEELPVYEKLGLVRDLLIGRANLALLYLRRNREGDRQYAISLLYLALEQAEKLRIPEAEQIRLTLKRTEYPPTLLGRFVGWLARAIGFSS